MTLSGITSSSAGGPSSRQLHWPFAGLVVLLVALILLTPNLFATSGGGLGARAQLIVDRAVGDAKTSFYVESIGSSTRYHSIDVGVTSLSAWPYRGALAGLDGWNWTNGTEMLALVATNASNPVAVNVTVTFSNPTGFNAEYVGVYAFYFNATTQSLEAVSLLPGASPPPTSTPVADLPIFLLLSVRTPTGSP